MQKVAEIDRLRREQGKDWVSDEELAPFVKLSQSDMQMVFYKDKADALANDFLERMLSAQLEENTH